VHKRTLDRKGRYLLREMRHGDYHRLREMNIDLFFAPLRHELGPVGFLQAAMKQQKDPERSNFFMGVADAKTDQLIGSIMVFDKKPLPDGTNAVEIGYFIDPLYQKIHFATDATVDLLGQLKERLNISKVVATVDPSNKPSRKILSRLGFKHVEFISKSKYKADPDTPESYYSDHTLKFRPRIVQEVAIAELFMKAKSVVQPDPALVQQRIIDARRDYNSLALRRDQVGRNLKHYLSHLRTHPAP